jgi:GNAT superfamily N-acetyltransferase
MTAYRRDCKSMKLPRLQLTARIARPSDFQLVARLCRRAAGPRDYVLAILRETIQRGGLFLAWNDSELVGMTNFEKCVDGSGWLGMARTDPDWRRSGVAIFLQKQIASHAKKRGVTTLRLLASSRNTPSIRAIMKGEFKQVCEAAHISYHFKTTGKITAVPLCDQLSEAQFDTLLDSGYLSQMNGYLAYNRRFVKADKRLLNMVSQRGELYMMGGAAFILTQPQKMFDKRATSLSLLMGKVTDSFRRSKDAAKALGVQVMSAYIPYNRYQVKTARELRFRVAHWGRHCLVFERDIL